MATETDVRYYVPKRRIFQAMRYMGPAFEQQLKDFCGMAVEYFNDVPYITVGRPSDRKSKRLVAGDFVVAEFGQHSKSADDSMHTFQVYPFTEFLDTYELTSYP